MTVREYIGARYVPLFMGDWDNTKTYEPLSIVSYQGNSYTSTQYVPAGIEITNTSYWALTGNYNSQIEQYRDELTSIAEKMPSNDFDSINTIKKYIDDAKNVIPANDFDSVNTVKKYIDDVKDIIPANDFDSTNTIKKYIDDNDADKEYLISILGFTPENYNAGNAYVAISDDGLCYNYVKKIPATVSRIYVDPFLFKKDGIYYIIGCNDATSPNDISYYTTEDFDTYTYHQFNSGIVNYVKTTYGNDGGEYTWTPQLFKSSDGNYYLYSSASIDNDIHYDAFHKDSRVGKRRIFGCQVSIEDGVISTIGSVQEVIVNDNGEQIDSYFDMNIVEFNNSFYFIVKDGVYNYIVLATGDNPLGPFTVYARNVFKCIGTEAPIITPYNDGFIIYGQTYTYGSGENNFHINLAMYTQDFTNFEPLGFPRRNISKNCKTIRNLQAIPIKGKEIKKLFGSTPRLEYGSAEIQYVAFGNIAKYISGFNNCEIAVFCPKQNFVETELDDDYRVYISQFWNKFDVTLITNYANNATKGSITYVVDTVSGQGGNLTVTPLYNRSVMNAIATHASINTTFLSYREENAVEIPFEITSGVNGKIIIVPPQNTTSKPLPAILRFPSEAPDTFEVTVDDFRLAGYTLMNSGGLFLGDNSNHTKTRTCRVTKYGTHALNIKSLEASGSGGTDVLITLM